MQRRHLILDTPLSKARSASLGMVELSGLAVGPFSMVAPITQRPCYYYRTLAWEWKQSGKNKQWVKVAGECMHVPFFVDDNTGKVLVDPRGAELDLHRDFEQEFCDSFFTTKKEAPPNVHSFLQRHGVNTTNKIKVEEFCIKPKNALFLLGTLAENPGPAIVAQPIRDDEHDTLKINALWSTPLQPAFGAGKFSVAGGSKLNQQDELSVSERLLGGSHHSSEFDPSLLADSEVGRSILEVEYSHAASSQIIKLSPSTGPAKLKDMTQQEKVVAALMKAGISNPAAWTAAGATPPPIVKTESLVSQGADNPAGSQNPAGSASKFDLQPRVVLMKGKKNPTFVISWRSQRDVARSLGWKCTLMIWGGPALTLLCLYGLHVFTHWF